MEAELQTYLDQLAYVNLSLETDPENDELVKLRTELNEIIDLTRTAIAQTHPQGSATASGSKSQSGSGTATATAAKGKGKDPVSNWQDNGVYKAGMDCMAKYKDGKWYPARISAVVGSQDSPLYTITFKGYSSSTNVPLSSLRPDDPNAPIPKPQPQSQSTKRQQEELTDKEKEKKKAKGEKWMAKQTARADEVKGKKSAWEKFGKKAQKKGIHIAGLEGTSVFRTSDSVTGRVGVVGSGQGITDYERMGKHKFSRDETE